MKTVDLEKNLAVGGAMAGLGVARFLKNTGSILQSTGKFVVDSAVKTAKVVRESAIQNAREAKLKLR